MGCKVVIDKNIIDLEKEIERNVYENSKENSKDDQPSNIDL